MSRIPASEIPIVQLPEKQKPLEGPSNNKEQLLVFGAGLAFVALFYLLVTVMDRLQAQAVWEHYKFAVFGLMTTAFVALSQSQNRAARLTIKIFAGIGFLMAVALVGVIAFGTLSSMFK